MSDLSETVVYCKNLNNLIKHVQETRKTVETDLKIEIDGGGGFLKICFSIQLREDWWKPWKWTEVLSYKDGISAKTFEDTSIKKLFILALAPSTQEHYENVNHLWSNWSWIISTER